MENKTNLYKDYKILGENDGSTLRIKFNKCSHSQTIKIEDNNLEIPCNKCYMDGIGHHFYCIENEEKRICEDSEVTRTCHLCHTKDSLSNLVFKKSNKGKYYANHKECIDANDGYVIKKDNPHNKNKKTTYSKNINKKSKKSGFVIDSDRCKYKNSRSVTCNICKGKYSSYFVINGKNNDKNICPECYNIITNIKTQGFNIENCIKYIDPDVRKYGREFLSMWKRRSFSYIHRLPNYNNLNPNTAHHCIHRYIDILYITLKMLNIPTDKKLSDYTSLEKNNFCRYLMMFHFLSGYGFPMTESDHNEYHEIYGKEKVDINSVCVFLISKYKDNKDICKEILKIKAIINHGIKQSLVYFNDYNCFISGQ